MMSALFLTVFPISVVNDLGNVQFECCAFFVLSNLDGVRFEC